MLTAPDFAFKQIIVVLLRDGETISFKNDNIIVTTKEKKIKHQSSCYRLFTLFLVGHCVVTSGLLERSKKFGFSIVLFNYNMRIYGYWNSKTEGNVLLRALQYKYTGLEIAQIIVKNKIDNQVQQLKYIRNKSAITKINITKLEELSNRLPNLELNNSSMLGIEGSASKIYFQSMFDSVNWIARKPRTKIDSINTLLDIGYTLLFSLVEAMLDLYGFDIYQGVYHKVFYQRKSLVCDMIEVFRPIIDYAIRKSYNLKQVNEDDFLIKDNRYYLIGNNSQKYIQILLEILMKNKQDIFLYIQAYYRAFIQQKNFEDYPRYIIESC